MTNPKEIIEKANRYLITSFLPKMQPIVVENAKGAKIFDVHGKEFIDFFAGYSVVNAGHCQEQIVEAAINQTNKLIHAGTYLYYTKPAIYLAEKLAELTDPSLSMTFFGNTGAEAVETALKLARKFTKKFEFISLMGSFHGRTLGALSITGQASRKKYDLGPFMTGIAYAHPPYCYRCHFEKEFPSCNYLCARSLENTIDYETSKGVAAFIAEPVMGGLSILSLLRYL